jgi:hypothetical protein
MNHRIRNRAAATAWLVLDCCLLAAVAGCATAATGAGRRAPHAHDEVKTVLVRGQLPGGGGWQLAAWVQDRQLGMDMEEPSGHRDSGQVSFTATRDYSYHWAEGLGPGDSIFYYGPVPPAAVSVRLTAPGQQSLLVRTALLPAGHGLPRGRFFVIQPPGPVTVSWTVVPLDAGGQRVAFTRF